MTLEHSSLIQAPGWKSRVSEKIEEVHALAPSLLVPYHSLLFEVEEKDRPARKSPDNESSIWCFRHHNLFLLKRYMFRMYK